MSTSVPELGVDGLSWMLPDESLPSFVVREEAAGAVVAVAEAVFISG